MSEATKTHKSGDEDADEVLKYVPALRAYARSLTKQHDDADDLVQTTLLKAIANISKFQRGTNLRAWLFTIMRNTFFTDIRKRAREFPGKADCASTVLSCAPAHDERIAGTRLLQCIERLPRHYREALLLVVMIGESYETTAEICGCAIGTVKSRVNRARAMVIADLGAKNFLDVLEVR